jgi:hypothetical protein
MPRVTLVVAPLDGGAARPEINKIDSSLEVNPKVTVPSAQIACP